jgi:histidinol-phosphate aminotransferase
MTETKTPQLRPRQAVERMGEYHPPLAGREGLLRLDFNENTAAPSPRVLERLRSLSALELTKYPEREPAEHIVAQHFGFPPDQVMLTNGVDEAIHLLTSTFLDPGDEAIIATPTFAMYDIQAQAAGATVHRIASGPDFAFPFEAVMRQITERTRFIPIASPNNPTGAVVARDYILTIAAAAPQAVILADEAYYHFHGETVLPDIGSVPNLFVARTFSKVYGLAGLRLGVIFGPADLMRFLRKAASPYNVNAAALACVQPALEDESYVRWYVEEIHYSRDLLERTLTEFAVPHWPSHSNYILMHIGDRFQELIDRMRKRGVLLRSRNTDHGCAGCVRMSVGTREDTQQGITALRSTLKEMLWQKPN